MATVYFAKWILGADGEIITNGAIAVDNDLITSIGPRSVIKRTSKDRIVNLGKRLLLPGLINLHTHLEEGVVRGDIKLDTESFTAWSLRKNKRLTSAQPDELLSTIRLGIRESLANGITTVVDTSRTDISPIVLRDEPIRSWVIHEVYSEDECNGDQAILLEILQKRIKQSRLDENIGIAPHALYSLSPPLHKMLATITKNNNYLWACHMAESADELQAFSEQSGELYFHQSRKRPWPFDKTERGSMNYGITKNLIPNNGILYHCNYVTGDELTLLSAKNISIVLCSQYSELFGHKRFPMEAAFNRDINICLGTESPVSLGNMNLFDEIYHIKSQYPHLSVKELLNWVTRNPAKALHCSHLLGTLEPGKKADIIGIRFSNEPNENIIEEMLDEELVIDFVMVNGEEVIVGN